MEEIDVETTSLKESNENQNEPKKAPIWAFGMHWPIISGREATWGVLGAVGLPLQTGIHRLSRPVNYFTTGALTYPTARCIDP